MKTYIINIKSRRDRRDKMDLLLRKNGFEIPEEGKKNQEGFIAPDLRVEWTTHWDYNKEGTEITDEWLKENGFGLFDWQMDEGEALVIDQHKAKWWSRPLTKGEIGCTLSHWAVWNDTEFRDGGPITVLEDDALFDESMELKRDLAIATLEAMGRKWDLLYLGRVPLMADEKRITPNIVIPKFSYCTYGYVLSESGIEKIKKYNVHKGIIPADEFLVSTYIVHPRMDVTFKYPPALEAYAIDPYIVGQRPKSEVGSDTGLPEEDNK